MPSRSLTFAVSTGLLTASLAAGGCNKTTNPGPVEPEHEPHVNTGHEHEDAPAEDAPAEDAPAEDAPAEDAPAEDAPAEDAPAE